MICKKCGSRYPQGASFCAKCGLPLVSEEPPTPQPEAENGVNIPTGGSPNIPQNNGGLNMPQAGVKPPKPVKKSKAPIVITIIIVLLLIAGAAAAGIYTFVLKPENTAQETAGEGSKIAHNKDGSVKSENDTDSGEFESISVMATTILTEANGHDEFCAEYERLTGIELTIEKPDHNQYYEKLAITFAADDPADVIEIGSSYYQQYAADGVLWDMTEAWESSDLYSNSDVVTDKTKEYADSLRVKGEDGKTALYGFPNQRGGGTVTYVRKDWMDALGIDTPTNYEEFYDMLTAFKDIGDCTAKDSNGVSYKEKYSGITTYPLTVAGLISTESPYTMYLREFYQDARPEFYLDETTGEYVDGVLEPEMEEALERIQQAWEAGVIDPGSISNKTSTCRDKFQSGLIGCFNYWAGAWNRTLDKNLQAYDETAEMMALPSFDSKKEYYIERPSTAYCIPELCDYPKEVFENFILFSHDGGEGQLLFTHGVEGVHYTVDETDENGNIIKAEALYTMADPSTLFEKAFYDSAFSITEFNDPFEIDPRIENSLAVFDQSSEIYSLPVYNPEITDELAEIDSAKQSLLYNISVNNMSVENALDIYKTDTEEAREKCLKVLNN